MLSVCPSSMPEDITKITFPYSCSISLLLCFLTKSPSPYIIWSSTALPGPHGVNCIMHTSRSRSAHSFEGCKTCRKRHLKCDQTTPRCKRCCISGLKCDFRAVLRWVLVKGPDDLSTVAPPANEATQYSRRHLYSGESEGRYDFDNRCCEIL